MPSAYRGFLKEFGGCFVGGLIDGSVDLPISQFLGTGECGILWTLRGVDEFKKYSILPIATCEFGNLYAFDLKNAVHYINYYGGQTLTMKVADSFQEFLDRIVPEEE